MRICTLAVAYLLIAFLIAPVAGSQQAGGWGYDAWHELMSPYCPGRTLADCPSPQADDLRAWILSQEQQGRTKDEVLAELYGTFGDTIRQAPAPKGLGVAAYVIPVLIFVAGGALIAFFLRRQSGAAEPVGAPGDALEDPDLQRALDEEIAS